MISLKNIQLARTNISDTVAQTPLLSSATLSEQYGNQLFLKAEHLQKTGSFKIRGAANKVLNEANNGAKHVVAASSGNHGQAVAYIARQLGIQSTIVVPVDAALCKQEAIQAYNGKIELCGTTSPERLARAEEISQTEEAVFIPPYDDPAIMAGQGTIGLEILEQLPDVDVVYVPVGGGGLISGIATAIKESNPHIQVIGVEPALANDTFMSIQEGKRVSIGASKTIADGLRTSTPGELTFPVVQRYVDDIVLVTEDQIKHAFSTVLSRMKQVIEPSAAAAVAAALAHKAEGKRIVAVVSGGNVDLDQIPNLLTT
ncbi:threonine/serine dehydratase [Ammoniphilus sp. CFH 90114]|uniref:threonine ammonia-lyase n=1 Tax=Ammoniphilus sp. CFH 90114 TaxID=2493665 RepID=UPI00100DE87C|nr:threonine/serine dehydratase [Ammoniphilus sp. CFH 90114]RXT13726.1 threonine/serine dehydratase [Ammoniphilus sp. CFH 90114]